MRKIGHYIACMDLQGANWFQRPEFLVDTGLLQDCIGRVPALDMKRDSEAAVRDGTVPSFMTAIGRPPVFAVMIAQDPAKIAVEVSH
jgi:hypothetical protein